MASSWNNFDLDDLDRNDLAAQVVQIHICGYKNEGNEGDEDGNPPTNQWAMFLEVLGGRSVRVDMIAGYGSDGRRGKISTSSKHYQHTDNAIKTLSFGVTKSATVNDICGMIISKGRDKYKFTVEEEGCRYWIYTIISDLEIEGMIESGCKDSTWASVSYYWRYPTGYEVREVKQGTFN